ncbi:MAG TPA: tRNA-binding protein [Stellaceae bacterium]|jgi:tRNA-binding protein
MKPVADYAHFEALDLRVGRVLKVEDARSRKPTYRLTIDLGAEIGIKVSCGAYRNYAPEALVGKTVVAVVNFPEKRMGPEVSQVLVLGVTSTKGETIYLTPESEVPPGGVVF